MKNYCIKSIAIFIFFCIFLSNCKKTDDTLIHVIKDEYTFEDPDEIGKTLKTLIVNSPDQYNILEQPENADFYKYINTLMYMLANTDYVTNRINFEWDVTIIQDDNIALIGYSMGGYGALIYAGAGVTLLSTTYEWGAPQGLLERNMMQTDTHMSLDDDRVKAVVAFGPWGNNTGFWDAQSWSGIEKPLMLIAGGIDDVSQYEAIRGIFDDTVNTTRHLLTFEGANHNAGAPMPAPAESYAISETLGYAPFDHYADAVWDHVRMNNVSQHFVSGYLDLHLKGDTEKEQYFALTPVATDGVWSVDDDGAQTQEHSYWTGFPNRTAAGLRFETKAADE